MPWLRCPVLILWTCLNAAWLAEAPEHKFAAEVERNQAHASVRASGLCASARRPFGAPIPHPSPEAGDGRSEGERYYEASTVLDGNQNEGGRKDWRQQRPTLEREEDGGQPKETALQTKRMREARS